MVGLGWLFVVVIRLFMCGVLTVARVYLCSFVGVCTSVPLFVCLFCKYEWRFIFLRLYDGTCTNMYAWEQDIILIQSKIVFEFKNLTAICFHAARWI